MDFIKLDKQSSLPMHVQITNALKEALRSGQLKADDQIPTEEELSKVLQVSRPVIRQAYRSLMEEHLIYRFKGKGSFVAHPQVEYNLFQSVNSLTEQIQALGLNTYIQTLNFETLKANNEAMTRLELKASDQIFRIERLYYGDKKALFYFDMMVPAHCFEGLTREQIADRPFMKLVQDQFNLTYFKSMRTFYAVILSNTICDYLALPHASAGFCMENVSWDEQGHILEFSKTYFGGLSSKIRFDFSQQP